MNKEGRIYNFTAIFESTERGCNVMFPAIPEICTFGKTIIQAREMAKNALQCYLESCFKEEKSFPQEKITIEKIAVII